MQVTSSVILKRTVKEIDSLGTTLRLVVSPSAAIGVNVKFQARLAATSSRSSACLLILKGAKETACQAKTGRAVDGEATDSGN